MMPFLTLVLAGFLSRVGYQMARRPVFPRFAQDLGAAPELIGMIVAASTVTGVLIKLPAGALSDVLGRKRMMLLGCFLFAGPPFLYPFVDSPGALLALRFLHRPQDARGVRSLPHREPRRPPGCRPQAHGHVFGHVGCFRR